MHFLTLLAAATPALATFSPAVLNKRQDNFCLPSEKECGNGCISATWECCPREDGGCPPSQYCIIGDNDETGCCVDGWTCVGDGGVNTRTDFNTWTSTIWSTIEQETSTVVDDDTTTYSASLPILTLTSTTESEVPAETTSVPPVDLPSPIPTGNETSTIVPPVPTGGAAAKNMAGNLIGGVAAGAAVLLM